ncbi:hypothetical protein LP52_05075 [Streptomonospora alba]|uniref:Asparagine synthetase domain-containing protein n=1 Tax=Streptomonospora alba TaxID=183763 RepID=A0A0C2JE93_9ACTN|nr:hypothetical protein LP52_05075 [Streptomonospora alba]
MAASVRNRDIEVYLFGTSTDRTDDVLARDCAGRRRIDELDRPLTELVEADVVAVAREPRSGRLRLQAPVFQTRAFCWTERGSGTVFSDDQFTLAQLSGLDLDLDVLAGRLTDLGLSYPFAQHTVWSGISTAPPGTWTAWEPGHGTRNVTWWQPPSPDRSTADLADPLRAAMSQALSRRIQRRPNFSSDLSGGLDSTTLGFILAEDSVTRTAGHHTLFLASVNRANRDHEWASRAADEIGSHHIEQPYQTFIDALGTDAAPSVDLLPEGPGVSTVAIAATPRIRSVLKPTGSRIHLNGHGGDALFGPVPSLAWSLLRSNTPGRLRKIRRHRVLNRYPLFAMSRMLLHRGSLRRDLADLPRHLDDARAAYDIADFSRWVNRPRIHPAMTAAARERLHSLVEATVRADPQPLSADLTTHEIMQYLTVHGAAVRGMNRAVGPSRRDSVPILFDSPYLDRHVVDLALSLDVADRAQQYPAKPLLAAARPPTMSLDYFTRRDKGDYTAEVFDQHRALNTRIGELFADGSLLEDMGLVDPRAVLESAQRFSITGREYTDLAYLAFAEEWVRSVRLHDALPESSGTA